MKTIRLNKFLAQCGRASRRQGDLLIQQKRVMVNDQIITELGCQIDPVTDRVLVDGQLISPETEKLVILNKPEGYLVTARDPQGRKTIYELLSDIDIRLFPVGRLDYLTSGLLLLTNDGDLAHKLAHPRFHVRKTYQVLVAGMPGEKVLDQLRQGVRLEDGMTAPARVRVMKVKKNKTLLELKIYEGRKRQIRRMADAVGFPVMELKRVAIDQLSLGNLPSGQWRYLTDEEVKALKRRVNQAESQPK